MDTIVYLEYVRHNVQDARGTCNYILKEHVIQDYRLIKVRVTEAVMESVDEGPVRKHTKSVSGKASVRKVQWDIFSIGKRLQHRHDRRLQNQNRSYMSGQLRLELAGCLEERDEIYLCCDESVKEDSWVRKILPFPEFSDYLQRDWVQRLLPETYNHHFMVLGDAFCIRDVLWELAPHMKSLLWIAPDIEAQEYLEDFAEDFYQETGLAIRLQFLVPGTTYGQLTIPENFCKETVTILDFTEERHIPRFYPRKGSVWLDFASDSDKECRICARGLSCDLISLRKQWKKAPFA